MSYSVFSSLGSYVDSGTFSVYAGTSPDRVEELCAVVEEQFAELVEHGPSERELDVARGGFEGATVLGLEDAGSRMAQIATGLLVRDRVVDVSEYLEKVRAVTADDVQRVLSTILSGTQARSVVEPR